MPDLGDGLSADVRLTFRWHVPGSELGTPSGRRSLPADGGPALIEQWLKNKDTVLFLGVWERLNNPQFKTLEFEGIKNEAGRNSFYLSAKKWADTTVKGVSSWIRHQTLSSLLLSSSGELDRRSGIPLLHIWKPANRTETTRFRLSYGWETARSQR